jgi:periplasmic protein TonB
MHYPQTVSPPPPPPPPPPAPQQTAFIENPIWVQRPTVEDMQRYYPRRALERGEAGRVILDCTVIYGGRLSCRVRSENPSGRGFGEAALSVAREFRIAATQPDGSPTNGARLTVPIAFQVDDNDGRRR